MKRPSLQKTAALSAALHATIFLLSMIVLRNSSRMLLPSPYIVNLVSPGEVSSGPGTAPIAAPKVETAAVEKMSPDTKVDERRIEDSIAELMSKKKIERIVRIRNEMLSIKGVAKKPGAAAKPEDKGEASGRGGEMTYADRIRAEIHRQWTYPDTFGKNHETIVAVKILKDGTIKIEEIEKKSGDRIFDKSVLKAIELASPVTPPPYDGVEFGIRFTP